MDSSNWYDVINRVVRESFPQEMTYEKIWVMWILRVLRGKSVGAVNLKSLKKKGAY